jgi:hypothetical protein
LLAENSPIKERNTGARERERGRETCLLAGNSPILGKEMAEERETCLLAEISPILWKEMKREREICLLAGYSPITEKEMEGDTVREGQRERESC